MKKRGLWSLLPFGLMLLMLCACGDTTAQDTAQEILDTVTRIEAKLDTPSTPAPTPTPTDASEEPEVLEEPERKTTASDESASAEPTAVPEELTDTQLQVEVPYEEGTAADTGVRTAADGQNTIPVTVTNNTDPMQPTPTPAPDTYTVVLADSDDLLAGTALTPLCITGQEPYVLVSAADEDISDLDTLLSGGERAETVIAVTGANTVANLLGRKLEQAIDGRVYVIAFDTPAQAVASVQSGEADVCVCTFSAVQQGINAGTLVPLAETGAEYYGMIGSTPPLAQADSRFAGLSVYNTFYLAVSADTDASVVSYLRQSFGGSADIAQQLAAQAAQLQALKN